MDPESTADVNTGKSISLLGSDAFFVPLFPVTPSSTRSIPRLVFDRIVLPRMALPRDVLTTATPSVPLLAMTLPDVDVVPPTVVFVASMKTPHAPLPSAALPFTSTPI